MKYLLLLATLLLTACANTQFQHYEGRNNAYVGQGGSKVVKDGMEIWDNGDPPRKFKLIGVIDDERSSGIIPMSKLNGDMVKKAREAGGDALIKIHSESQITGYMTGAGHQLSSYGNNTTGYSAGYASASRKHISKYAVIKYLD
jgi:hypothetical protein